MPFHLSTAPRRSFLAQLGGAAMCGAAGEMPAQWSAQLDLIAILNDTHIAGGHPAASPIPSRLREAVSWLAGLQQPPAAVIINGDLALNDGQAGDYAHFARLIAPLSDAGIPVHLTLGNHDNRDVFCAAMKSCQPGSPHVAAKHVGIVPLPKATLFLLDSLKGPRAAHGLLGPEQLEWLARSLDEHPGKPALIFAHHNPRLGEEAKHFPSGLEDSDALWHILVSRPHVKAYVHGHIHHRHYSLHRGIHIIDTPATGFVSRPAESTTGWTIAQLSAHGAEFTTLTHLKEHPWNGATERLTWRAG